jgi:hypothetical protein
MKFEDREHVLDGDILFIKNDPSLTSKIIRFFTKSKYSHCGIAFWIYSSGTKRLMMVEAQNSTKRRIVNASNYDYENVDVVSGLKHWSDIEGDALMGLGLVNYSMREAIEVGAKEFMLKFFNVNLPISKDEPGEICSQFIAKVEGLDNIMVSPEGLYEALLKQGSKQRFI